jgi:hypothetical protein
MPGIDYKALLEELKKDKAEIERMIAYAEQKLGAPRRSPKGDTVKPENQDTEILPDTFHNKNILQATEKYLGMVGRPARSTEEIAEALGRGGLGTTPGSVATILGRSKDSQVQRVKRGLWGLADWYKAN